MSRSRVPGPQLDRNVFFEFDWNGTRAQDNGGGNGDHRKAVRTGRYILS